MGLAGIRRSQRIHGQVAQERRRPVDEPRPVIPVTVETGSPSASTDRKRLFDRAHALGIKTGRWSNEQLMQAIADAERGVSSA